MRRIGRLEAEVESLELKWVLFRDELKKLVNRLEKREERAEKRRLEHENNGEVVNKEPDVDEFLDVVSQRVIARRNRHGVSE